MQLGFHSAYAAQIDAPRTPDSGLRYPRTQASTWLKRLARRGSSAKREFLALLSRLEKRKFCNVAGGPVNKGLWHVANKECNNFATIILDIRHVAGYGSG